MTTLKPCPFCNTPGEQLIEEATSALEIRGNCYQDCWIECPSCGCTGPSIEVSDAEDALHSDYDMVRYAWNSRFVK